MASSSWMTTFYFQQDLRSYFMNGLLNAGFRPGVYNADIALYTTYKGTSGASESGIYAIIKKGTTLIFSNALTKDTVYHRDFTGVGSYLIKCVALEDVTITLAELSGPSSATLSTVTTLCGDANSTGVYAQNKIFLTALMKYDPEQEDYGSKEPEFCLAKISDNPTSGNGYYQIINNTVNYALPDGQSSVDTDLSYLFLGALNTPYSERTYASSGSWSNSGSYSLWVEDHALVARGLPEYRQALIANNSNNSPDLLIAPNFKDFYLDTGDVYAGDVFYNKTTSWEDVYGITSTLTNSDFTIVSKEENYSSKPTCAEQLASLNSTNAILFDVFFATVREKYSNIEIETSGSINNLFQETIPSSQSIAKSSIGLKHIRIASRTNNTDAGGFAASALNPGALRESFGITTTTAAIAPLDLGKINIERLRGLLKNRNIFPAVVDHMRYQGFLDPTVGTELVPLALVFRGVYDNILADTVSQLDTNSRIHPANILGIADLQFKTTKLETFSVKDTNTYNVVSVMD